MDEEQVVDLSALPDAELVEQMQTTFTTGSRTRSSKGRKSFLIATGPPTKFARGVDMSENAQALEPIIEKGPGQHFLGTAHTLANFETAFYRSQVADNNSFEQWLEDGSKDTTERANAIWKKTLAD